MFWKRLSKPVTITAITTPSKECCILCLIITNTDMQCGVRDRKKVPYVTEGFKKQLCRWDLSQGQSIKEYEVQRNSTS